MKHLITCRTSTKSVLFLLLSFFVFNLNFGQSETVTSLLGVLTFKSETINYGKIQEFSTGERTFSFTNTGKAPVVISQVKPSCGCAVPTYPKAAILPGDSGDIKIKYATNRVGSFSKTITVLSNAKNSEQILKIKGEVLKSSI